MNGAQIRMVSKIRQLFMGILLLLATVPFNLYFLYSIWYYSAYPIFNTPANPSISVLPYIFPGNPVFYNGINIQLFEIDVSLIIIMGILYGGSYHFMHNVFKYDNRKGAVSKSGYIGSIFLFTGLLLLLVSGLQFILIMLYEGTYNYTTGSTLLSFLGVVDKYSRPTRSFIYILGAVFLIIGIFLISIEFLKLSIRYSSHTLALGSVTLFLLILSILNTYSLGAVVGVTGGEVLYAISSVSLFLILFGLRDVSKKIKEERATSIEIPYL